MGGVQFNWADRSSTPAGATRALGLGACARLLISVGNSHGEGGSLRGSGGRDRAVKAREGVENCTMYKLVAGQRSRPGLYGGVPSLQHIDSAMTQGRDAPMWFGRMIVPERSTRSHIAMTVRS